jgi:hypothetical protein
MAWYVVRNEICSYDIDDPDAEVWTLSRDPNRAGWETDGGCGGYGLKKADAEELAAHTNCVNRNRGKYIDLAEWQKIVDENQIDVWPAMTRKE